MEFLRLEFVHFSLDVWHRVFETHYHNVEMLGTAMGNRGKYLSVISLDQEKMELSFDVVRIDRQPLIASSER